jgi:FlhB-like protein
MEKRTAVALTYTKALEAPVVIARGKNELATRMLEIARENGIQIVTDPDLAGFLSESEIGACIPVEAYQAVAAIFAFLEKGIRQNWVID